ncbi:MAG: GNAT family N-acetyltransferase [Gemmatimonadota bacterium]
MPAITLVSLDESSLAALSSAPGDYASIHGFDIGSNEALIRGVAEQSLTFRRDKGIQHPWAGYLAVDAKSLAIVGTCSFTGPPGSTGAVEIAYYTFPGSEGQGYATAMAEALRAIAVASADVRVVTANTLAQGNASTRILDKLGFTRVGDNVDPDDGAIWQWEWRLNG